MARLRSAIHYRQICPPGPHGLAILLRHHARRLSDGPQVVRDPRRQQLTERHGSELGMFSFERELRLGQSPSRERRQTVRSSSGEFVEQLLQRLALTLPELREPIERLEAAIRALCENDL